MTSGVGVPYFPDELGGAPRLRGDAGEQVVVHLRTGPVGHHDAGGELGELADHPDEEDAREPVSDGLLEGVSGEVPDLYEAHLFEVGEEAHGGLLGETAGREDEGVVVLGAHDVYGLADAGPPGSGRERADDAGGAEAYPLPAVELDARLLPPGDPCRQVRPVGDVRVVAGVLYDDGLGPAIAY